jgi:acyl-CoA oxidase
MAEAHDAVPLASVHPEIVPILPLVAAMWEDGIAGEADVRTLRAIAIAAGLSAEAAESLDSWTEPTAPPTPTELSRVHRFLRSAQLADERAALASLSDFGLALRSAETSALWATERAASALREAEESLGLPPAETTRTLRGLGPGREAESTSLTPPDPTDPTGEDDASRSDALRKLLERDRAAVRAHARDLLIRPEMTIPLGLPHHEYRERVLEAVRLLADEGIGSLGYPKVFGGGEDPGAAVAAFETLAFGDLSIVVKFGVQFGLFGGSILQLGTRRHHEAYLGAVGRLELPGCYAMTETGHGSNVRDLETTATYDAATRELVVHSPTEESGKDWIGNAARHGRLAVVFARLVVGDEDHGVHAVLVPIRDARAKPEPGVRIEDRGLKLGLNGVDNGRIWFDSVRVPVDNLLDRFATIDEQGRYQSPIPSSGRRFFTMLGTLVAGRVSIASASVSAAKVGLTIAVRYAAGRRQFGPADGSELPILTYTAVQRALMPRLAATYGLHFAARRLQARYAEAAERMARGRRSASASDADAGVPAPEAELEVLAAGLKAWASDHCTETLRACREACGGQGYLAENRFAALKADTDVFTTFEGANDVLYQLAAKGLLSRFRDEVTSLDLRGIVRYLSERAETSLTELNPVVTRRTDEAHLLDPSLHRAALEYREARLLRSVAERMRSRSREGTDSFDAVNEVQDHLIALARAHVERVVLEAFQSGVEEADHETVRAALQPLAALYALSRIEADRGWFLEAGYLEAGKSRAVRRLVTKLCREVSGNAPELVDGFGVPEALLPGLVRR